MRGNGHWSITASALRWQYRVNASWNSTGTLTSIAWKGLKYRSAILASYDAASSLTCASAWRRQSRHSPRWSHAQRSTLRSAIPGSLTSIFG